MVDPAKLLASASRLFGDQMDELWGEFLPVPADQVEVLQGGESLSLGRQRFRVEYTPGHASHHVSYLDESSGTVYVGDTAGVLPVGLPCVVPVTPPPEFDLERWLRSIDTILAWRPERLYLTHFGFSRLSPAEHFSQLREGLADWTETARRSLNGAGEDEARATQFSASVTARLASRLAPEQLARFVEFADFRGAWYGLARYWRKRLERA